MENKRPNNPRLNRNQQIDGIVGSRSPQPIPVQPRGEERSQNQQEPAISLLPPLRHTKNHPNKSKKKIIIAAIALVVVVAIAVGLVMFMSNPKTKAPSKPKETQTESRASANADEKKPAPDTIASYKVAADLPRVLSIEKIKVKSRILALGVKNNNELKAPVNIYDTGWYLESAKPGEPGAMLLDGHVTGPTQKGIFYDLKKLVAGDTIKIERGDGKTFVYKVVSSKVYDKDKVDMAAALTPIEAGKPGLNLITCAGSFNAQSDQYEDRLVVFASLQA